MQGEKENFCFKSLFICIKSLNFAYRPTAVSGVGSSPALATCETSQVLLAGVSGDFP